MPFDRSAAELKAVAPILARGELIGTCTFVTSGTRTVGVTSSERLRPYHTAPLAIATKLDGSATIPVASWSMRFGGVAIVEVTGLLGDDVVPLQIGSVCATLETRGAPSAVVARSAGRPRPTAVPSSQEPRRRPRAPRTSDGTARTPRGRRARAAQAGL